MVDLPTHLCNQSKNWFDGWILFYRRKGILIVNPLNLWVSLSHKYGIVPLFVSIWCMIYLEDPSQTHNWFIYYSWDHFHNTFIYNGFIFLHNFINPYWLLYYFLERGWLSRYKLNHYIHVSIVFIWWPSLPVLIWRSIHILPHIPHKSLIFPDLFPTFFWWFFLSGCFHSLLLNWWLLYDSMRLLL